MTYSINGKEFTKNINPEETYNDIVRYLNETASIIVDSTDYPLNKSDILEQLEQLGHPIFATKLVSDHEKEVLHNVHQFSKELLSKVEDLEMKSNEDILSAFSELSDTLLELSSVDTYFQFNKIIKEEVEATVKQAEQKLLENDYASIADIIELIYSEWLEGFVEELELRKGIFQ
ncbi:hypothetical protein [uncultured Brevibacillus sp.]|uniref:hypothetical protein n=1 Tax=uncultured Brevibacillus sp. TaxID=169970 RepID=UPI0025936BC1|nr:hypothetical protein [uncultured Brevibacillus sp.]